MSKSNWESLFTNNSVEIPIEDLKLDELISSYLGNEEVICFAFKYVRDIIVFTNKRYIYINPQKLNGKKIERTFLPWKYLIKFSTENVGGFLDGDHDIKFTFAHVPYFEIQLKGQVDLEKITRFLSLKQLENC
jgi:Bacterial PH domain